MSLSNAVIAPCLCGALCQVSLWTFKDLHSSTVSHQLVSYISHPQVDDASSNINEPQAMFLCVKYNNTDNFEDAFVSQSGYRQLNFKANCPPLCFFYHRSHRCPQLCVNKRRGAEKCQSCCSILALLSFLLPPAVTRLITWQCAVE